MPLVCGCCCILAYVIAYISPYVNKGAVSTCSAERKQEKRNKQ